MESSSADILGAADGDFDSDGAKEAKEVERLVDDELRRTPY